MADHAGAPLLLCEHRFERFERIAWWDQARLLGARVLLIGAGALGNEVLKNLSLLGVGHVAVVDMDRVEQSNLSRSVLFRESDEGQFKAEAAARAARLLYPEIDVRALVGNVLGDVGLGWFRWADVVVGALDNREARVFVNASCAMVRRPWIDGGIEVLHGIVRGFDPPQTACYECTMGEADWRQLNQRRSCSLLARRSMAEGGTPTTPTTASVIGAIQAQEVVKRLHGLESLSGAAFVFEGMSHNSYRVTYPINPECPWHAEPPPVEAAEPLDSRCPLRRVWEYGERLLGRLDALDLARDLVASLACPSCGKAWPVFQPIHRVTEEEAICGGCKTECVPEVIHSFTADSPRLDMTARQLGLPLQDVLWARRGEQLVGIELAGDRAVPAARDGTDV